MDLIGNGVNVWYDQWEIKPGDSLRRKIDEGIEGAAYFMVLLTPNSLESEWVQTELDAGMVRRIEGTCKLIPIILNLSDDQIPVTLRGLRWVRLESYDEGLRELLNVCHGVETKPPLGAVPSWAKPVLPLDIDLSIQAQRLAVLLCERSQRGDTMDPQLDASEVLQAMQITEEEAAVAADELEERGWVKLHLFSGMGRAGFGRITPEPALFFAVDPHVKGWNPEKDACTLAACLVNFGTDIVALKEADERLQWGPRRINPAAYFLNDRGFAKGQVLQSLEPYAFYYIQVTPRTKRFASQ